MEKQKIYALTKQNPIFKEKNEILNSQNQNDLIGILVAKSNNHFEKIHEIHMQENQENLQKIPNSEKINSPIKIPLIKHAIRKSPLKSLNLETKIRNSKFPLEILKFESPIKRPETQKISPLLSFNSFSLSVTSFQQNMGIPQRNEAQRECCNCRKSHCLKLYCECFAQNLICKGCHCIECYNDDAHELEKNEAIKGVLERNPWAFKQKSISRESAVFFIKNLVKSKDFCKKEFEKEIPRKGCTCKKTNCLKGYCDCYQAGMLCGKMCECKNCKNTKKY